MSDSVPCPHKNVKWGPLGHDEQQDGTFEVWQLGDCLDCGAKRIPLKYTPRRAE